MAKDVWLRRDIHPLGPYLCLCLSEAEYLAAIKRLKIKTNDEWISGPIAEATTHLCHAGNGDSAAIVCFNIDEGRDSIQAAGLLVHEAVHIWQQWKKDFGEKFPGDEQEAYAVQILSTTLMREYARRLNEKTNSKTN